MDLKLMVHSTRTILAALVAFSVLAIIGVTTFATLAVEHISREEDREVLEGYALIEGAYQLQLVADQEVIMTRDYLLAGRSSISREQIFREFTSALEDMKKRTEDPVSLQLIDDIGETGARYQAYAEEVLKLLENGRRAEALALFHSSGRQNRQVWMAKLEELLDRQHAYVASRHEEVNRVENSVKRVMAWSAALSIPTTLLLAWVIARRVIFPLTRLEAASREVAGGNIGVRVEKARDDEFGRVATAFNLMMDRIAADVTQLQNANEDLQRADQLKDQFLSIVSHELRTPLNFIKGFTSLMANEFAGPLTDQQRQYLDNIGQSTERMLLLVNDLLDVAAIQAGKLRLYPEPVIYGPLVEEAVQTATPLADEKQLELSMDIASDTAITIDPRRVSQVLGNLLANAVKFTPRNGSIHVRVVHEGHALRTEVTDTGVGIHPDDQFRLFQPFTQVDMTATRKAGGTGLGLSISKALVDAHGGTIGVKSAPGEGSTFWFTLPLPGPAASLEGLRTDH